MTRTITAFLVGGSFAVLLLVNSRAQVRPETIERGGQWLSWSPKERSTYVSGFISGYLIGTSQLCKAADELFKVRDPRRVTDEVIPGNEASALCFENRGEYTRQLRGAGGIDVGVYADVITEFYTKHPEYHGVPFPFLMEFLSDGKSATADQLYQRALKGEIRPVR